MDGEATNPRDAELVEHLGWVQRLAYSLAKDRDAADDLAQEAARVWLEKRPAHADGPRGWLAAVTRRLAIDRSRSESARRTRERQASRPEGEGESFEVVERGARQRRVVEAVLQLPEPYRSTILYRFLDGLPTRAVAERMHVPEATVRKRIERGLALLRERLDREFGSGARSWAFALLEPGLHAALGKGVGLMVAKWVVAAGAVVLLAGAVWYARGGLDAEAGAEVGGRGEVVPPEVAAARGRPQPVEPGRLDGAPEASRARLPAAPLPAEPVPVLRGYLYVDDVHRAPADVRIERKADERRPALAATVDPASATWSLSPLGGKPGLLWITSGETVPAQVPVPADVWDSGGTFDLHLSSGRTLVLTLLDQATKQPLPDLEFQVSRSVEVARSPGRSTSNGSVETHRTDASGVATVTGIPWTGWVSVTVDFELREADVVLRGGETSRMRFPREPDWQLWLKDGLPARIERTILVRAPLGEACAGGRVPPWAVAAAGDAANVRVVARDTTNETPQARGFPFVLPRDERGDFTLCANAPATLAVWLEKTDGGDRLSAETALEFARPGAQDPISFRPVTGDRVTLHFVNVPDHGQLAAWVVGGERSAPAREVRCAGAPFSRELTVGPGERIQVSLRLGEGKSGWSRVVEPGGQGEITVDLGGTARTVRLEADGLDLAGIDGSIALLGCADGEAGLGQSIAVLCASGRATEAVHVPAGRWLYRYDDREQVAVWGVVDVTAAARPGEELVLRPSLRLAPVEELQPGIRFDEIEGVSLAKLPEKFRTASAKGGAGRVALPLDARYTVLDGR